MQKRVRTTWIADDGREFDSKRECEKYEFRQKVFAEKAKQYKYYTVQFLNRVEVYEDGSTYGGVEFMAKDELQLADFVKAFYGVGADGFLVSDVELVQKYGIIDENTIRYCEKIVKAYKNPAWAIERINAFDWFYDQDRKDCIRAIEKGYLKSVNLDTIVRDNLSTALGN